jgi:citrate synthase
MQAASRLEVLSRQLGSIAIQEQACSSNDVARNSTAAEEEVRPAPGGGRGTLTVVDNRSGKKYTVGLTLGKPICAPFAPPCTPDSVPG